MNARLENVLRKLWIISRFTSYFFQSVHFEADGLIPTLGLTASKSGLTLKYNNEFIDAYSDDEVTGLLVHEMMHIILNHQHRRIKGKDVLIQNLAQDMVINTYLFENRKDFFSRIGRDIRDEPTVVLPDGLPLIPDEFYSDLKESSAQYDPSWKDVYLWLIENENTHQIKTTDKRESFTIDSRFQMPNFSFKKEGSTDVFPEIYSDDDGIIFKSDKNKTLPSGVHFFKESSLDDTVDSIKKRIVSYAGRDENAVAERLFQNISASINKIRPATINNFDKLVKRFLNQVLCSEDWSFSARRFNRRYFGEGLYAPGRYHQLQPSVTIAIDVSGSMIMKPGLIEKAFGAIESLLSRYTVSLICIDETVFIPRIEREAFVDSGSSLEKYIYRRGDWKYIKTGSNAATFFAPLFDTYMKDKNEPLIVITDGEIFDIDLLEPYKDTLWALPSSCIKNIKPLFGKIAEID